MPKQYRTARGKTVDLSQILNENENVRAVGNMNVNARGDAIDSKNKTVQSRNDRVKNAYRKQHKNAVVDDVVPTSKRHAEKLASIAQQYANEAVQQTPEQVVDSVATPEQVVDLVAEPKPVVEETVAPQGGLAAAIAKARESKQELLKTDRQQARATDGVKRI
jgi:hypothetical protein